MRASAYCLLASAVMICGCATSRYRILISGIDPGPTGACPQKFRLFPCNLNADGSYSRLGDADCKLVMQAAAKYPDVFSDDGEVVRIQWLDVKRFRDGQGRPTSARDNASTGLILAWNVLSGLTLCTLPIFTEHEYAYRIVLEFESGKLRDLGVATRKCDFVGIDQGVVSLFSPIGWLFPYSKPDDTAFYRTGFSAVPIDDIRNRKVFWQAAVARAATELRKANREIEFRTRDAERRRKQNHITPVATPSAEGGETNLISCPIPVPSAPQMPKPQSTFSVQDIPM